MFTCLLTSSKNILAWLQGVSPKCPNWRIVYKTSRLWPFEECQRYNIKRSGSYSTRGEGEDVNIAMIWCKVSLQGSGSYPWTRGSQMAEALFWKAMESLRGSISVKITGVGPWGSIAQHHSIHRLCFLGVGRCNVTRYLTLLPACPLHQGGLCPSLNCEPK